MATANDNIDSTAATLETDNMTENVLDASNDVVVTTTGVISTAASGGDRAEGVLTFTGSYVSGKEYQRISGQPGQSLLTIMTALKIL